MHRSNTVIKAHLLTDKRGEERMTVHVGMNKTVPETRPRQRKMHSTELWKKKEITG